MATHTHKNKMAAKKYAARMRAKGYNASIYQKANGQWCSSVTR